MLRQPKVFLPAMEAYRDRLVAYKVGDVEHEQSHAPGNFVERRLVLVAHDESTMQANDDEDEGWVLEGEQPIKKKGVGRGQHQSDVICSTVGWLREASQTLDYGKNYDGYWNGELFVKQASMTDYLILYSHSKQVEISQLKDKIIPAFERAHGPGYQALIMVDNSQGHSAWPEDALLVSNMNLNPG